MHILFIELLLLIVGTIMYKQILQYMNVNDDVFMRSLKLAGIAAAVQVFAGLVVFLLVQGEYFRVISLAGIIASSIALGSLLKNRMIISGTAAYMYSTGVTIGSSLITILVAVLVLQ
ncbi:MAG: Unknown protein [uncultured Thiotrichaceae bacterium]|uniref:Uncharacterized protein n=1 Tax=uncultured Thiotrichaceae bacterium TaxID=298394 RepID=A0A6S6TWL2_9GAMM|nr:MAG: Unknown protein [uncultured Thiotrichaceae bacterium]